MAWGDLDTRMPGKSLGNSGPSRAVARRKPKTKAALAAAVAGVAVPALNPNGQSGPQPVAGAPRAYKSQPQKTTGSTNIVRKLTAQENAIAAATKLGGPLRQRLQLEHAQARVGHKFSVQVRPDGTVVHVYGSDVAPELRNVVVGAAKRRARKSV